MLENLKFVKFKKKTLHKIDQRRDRKSSETNFKSIYSKKKLQIKYFTPKITVSAPIIS